ncbi:MAG TPA: magnesium transporter [Edaphocola sp.]|nr:magnesium transporter [Edaphocola sp.]
MENLETLFKDAEQLLEKNNDQELALFLQELNISEAKELIDEFPDYGPRFIELLPIGRAIHVFRILDFPVQERIIKKLPGYKISEIINELPPDDRTAFFSDLHADVVKKLIILLPSEERKEALGLLGYKEDSVGRLMTPDYIAVKKDWDVARVFNHIRKYGINSETIDVIYVIDDQGVLLDDLRIRKVLLSDPETTVAELTDDRLISLKADDPQEEAIEVFRMNNRVALPVTDDNNILLGIVTIDDILWVAKEEYTEDMQKMGGMDALDEPYLDTPFFNLIKKRAPWLIILFLSEMLTTTAMTYFQVELEKATVLALFIPLVMSSGGNSGSQASTLIIQAMAVGEVTIKDWWRVMRREILSGLALGILLGVIGFCRVSLWEFLHYIGIMDFSYGMHWLLIGSTIGVALVGIILWGSLAGSMLPIILKKIGADPAASSAPFVATLVDVTGIIIYFSVAFMFLHGTLLK